MVKTHEQLEEEAKKWSDKYDRSIGAQPESLNYSEMSDEELNKFVNTVRGQTRFNFWYPIITTGIILIIAFFIAKLF